MKTRLLFLLIAMTAASAGAAPLAIGAKFPSPASTLITLDGKSRLLSSFVGPKGTLVIFSCNTCPFAQAWEDRIVQIGNTYSTKGIGVVVVNSNDPDMMPGDRLEAMKKRATEKGMTFPYVSDAKAELADLFGASRTPESFLFTDRGLLTYHGAIDDNAETPTKVTRRYLQDALDSMLKNKRPATAETKAIGCTIKTTPKKS